MDVKTPARARILDAAERLFAERGIGDVSLREIGAAAGQRNNSAVQYHFGTREELVRALYEDRLAPLNVRRMELLGALDEEARTDVRALVDVYVRPLADAVRASGTGGCYARFIHRYTLEGVPIAPPLDEEFTHGVRLTTALLAGLLGVTDERLRLMMLLVTGALADEERRREAGEPGRLSYDGLVDAVVGLLCAPVSG